MVRLRRLLAATIGIAVITMVAMFCILAQQSGFKIKRVRAAYRTEPIKTEPLDQTPYTAVQNSNYSKVHEDRIRHLKEVCKNRTVFTNRAYKGRTHTDVFLSNEYNFSYCKVPKCGCTFWTQLFHVLTNASADDVFGIRRNKIHTMKTPFKMSFSRTKAGNSRMVLVSRDPYTRLYSAFVDKSYLGMLRNLNKMIRNSSALCNNGVSFNEFLRYIVEETRANNTLNYHWAPIFAMCSPCKVNQWILVKQETFSKDIEFVLTTLNVEPRKLKVILDALHDHRVEATIPGIIEAACKKFSSWNDMLTCVGTQGAAMRLWNSFKIQGYIDERIPFPPASHFIDNSQFLNSTLLTQLILDAIRERPLTPIESKHQRQRALVSAYKTVSKDTILGIQDVYRQDFALFGYDINPPIKNEWVQSAR